MSRPSDAAISVIILAAGAATRFGSPKLLQPLPGRPNTSLIAATVEIALAADLHSIFVVVGCQASAVSAALAGQPVEIVENPQWPDGLSSSIRAGLARLPAGVEAVLFLLGDQPAVRPATLTALIEAQRTTGAPILIPTFDGRRGNPTLFERRTFGDLARLTGDEGGRALVRSGRFRVAELAVPDPAILLDVDRPEDLERLKSSLP
jgi:molybdenum cofactor cytidylyltransferase